MESLDRDLTHEIPHSMNFDTDSNANTVIQLLNATSKATITSASDLHHQQQQQRSTTIGNQLLQKLGETLFGFGSATGSNSRHSIAVSSSDISTGTRMDLLRNHIVIDSADFDAVATSATSDLQQQLEYDKFMNEIWIGIVLTLIIISLVFCICSCFLYHQFRQWKRNYRHNLRQAQDIESVKLNPDADDPVPEYTLVSGLPSYEAALELMQKSTSLLSGGGGNSNTTSNGSSSCLIVYPSLFNVFSVNEKDSLAKSSFSSQSPAAAAAPATPEPTTTPQSPSIADGGGGVDVLVTATTVSQNVKCQNLPRLALHSIPSYEEATAFHNTQPQLQQLQQQQFQFSSDTSTCLIKSPSWCEDTTRVLLIEKKN